MEAQTAAAAPAQPAAEPVAPPPAVPETTSEPSRPSFADFDREQTAKDLARRSGQPEPVKAEPAKPVNDDDAPAVDAAGQQIRGADGKFVSKRQQAINESVRQAVERGISEERAKREALEREIADLKRGVQPKPAAETPKPAVVAADPPKPKMADFENEVGGKFQTYAEAVEAFHDARDAWREDKATRERTAQQEAEKQTAAERTVNETVTAHLEREAALIASVPDYHAKTGALRAELDKGLQAGAPLALPLLESPQSARLLLHFAEHPDDLTRIGTLGLTNLPAALRELGKLEAKYETPDAPVAAPAAPGKKTLSDAPPPPTTLGTRSAEPADPKAAALKRKDYSAYAREADREDLAVLRR